MRRFTSEGIKDHNPQRFSVAFLASLILSLFMVFALGGTGAAQAANSHQGLASAHPLSTRAYFPGARPFDVFVPQSYDPNMPAPLLIALHGFNQSGSDVEKLLHLAPAAAAHGILYVHPDGTGDTHGVKFWNATPECCDFQTPKVDDQKYLNDLIDQISARYNVDPARIYIVGHSNGGFMANAMACNSASRIAAIVNIAGGNYGKLQSCKPSQPINILQVWGTKDETYNFNHILGKPIAGAIKTIKYWAHLDGCSPSLKMLSQKIDLDTHLKGAETSVIQFAGCKNQAAVEMWKINGAGHQPHFSQNFDELMIQFLLSHPRASPNGA